ncbi:M48 family metallopeptidase [Candidatus Cyanaurora vandensis]|uniref:M48 family metallopeptidase n=1 Tax=Candidatus Cyanaurora vandensis TaxID=2714958 RepID=UPI00257CACD2|nr:SprT family zinc-dependent metalloprotease [Candidatus Cyanaurora vandensis]
MSTEPVPYRVRISNRARHVNLRLTVQEGLVVVIPRGFDLKHIPSILQKRKQWILAGLGRLAVQTPLGSCPLPEQLVLPLLGTWTVVYGERGEKPNQLLIPTTERAPSIAHLKSWLAHQGRLHLIPRLQQISHATGLTFTQATVRGQKTRWGSCSRQHHISLNYQLLFLTSDLVHYVLVHELCHTHEMNHSPRFWSLVASYLPDHQDYKARLRQSIHLIPGWLHD